MVCVLLSVLAVFAAPSAHAQDAGRVNFVKDGGAENDRFTATPARSLKRTMRRIYSRMVVHSPYFDLKLKWYSRAWTYKDLYGIFPNTRVARRHPEWILRGRDGNKLFIAYNCAGGVCPQYAGDITNPAFRRWWLRDARKLTRRGYAGLYIDDVNMIRRVSTGAGTEVTPRSARSGRRISRRGWRRAVTRFTRQIRRALPRTELVHNVIWFAPRPRDAVSRAQIRSADVISLERGINDPGLTRGGPFGLRTFLRYVDFLHSRGRRVLFDDNGLFSEARMYGLAGYFLMSRGGDLFSSPFQSDPDNFWPGYRVRLGAPRGRRFIRRGLIRRKFARGRVVLNQPGSGPRRVRVPKGFRLLGDRKASSVVLDAWRAAILVKR